MTTYRITDTLNTPNTGVMLFNVIQSYTRTVYLTIHTVYTVHSTPLMNTHLRQIQYLLIKHFILIFIQNKLKAFLDKQFLMH